ncbi:hypothetical protein C0989_005606 [Termitomyces sp. Mn162]|nr:hypothetical protein C0989_005606 [Termitomyces sp. Mn162]
MANLAVTLQKAGILEQAKGIVQQVLKAYREMFGNRHPDIIQAMENLAVTLQKAGILKEAEDLKQQILEAHVEVLGNRHSYAVEPMAGISAKIANGWKAGRGREFWHVQPKFPWVLRREEEEESDKDPKYINDSIPPCEQHERVVVLRKLIDRGIPCILWAEDAMRYAHRIPTCIFDQRILVPNHLLQEAAAGIRLKHRDVPEDHPYKLEPIPTWILLLPQSYFGLSVGSTERFQTLELGPSLSPLNAGILVPKYHTFLEGLVRFMMYQPTGDDVPHARGVLRHSVFFEYLLTYRVEYGENEKLPPLGQMYPAEHQILEELKTEDARWYIEYLFRKRESPSFDEILEFRAKDKITPS